MKDVQKTIEILQHISTQLTANALNHQIMSRVFASQDFPSLQKNMRNTVHPNWILLLNSIIAF
ncbi:hypothetical protein NYR65_08120 [Actinobacillus equuli subsp. equuli]|uniref:hypothetical protein n=1 Tax=Actinobacillus equuli TaxID=718 RepID=UPI0024425A19|nr:hypothetical protein [Actinobacillus equuli]WGE43867.1 hypothetical protein NYR65_08120 [Actinobacillus equuli subsp. equuli]